MWLVVMGLAGCKDLTPCEQAAQVEEPELVIGWGEHDFEHPLHDGDTITPASGNQGGRHLWLAVKTFGFVPGNRNGLLLRDTDIPKFHAELLGADDGVRYTDGWWQFQAMHGDPLLATVALGQFVVSGMAAEAFAQPLDLRVTGTDVCEDELVGEVEIGLTGIEPYGYY